MGTDKTKRGDLKFAVSQRFLPHYRLDFYELLTKELTSDGVRLKLFYGYPLGPVPERAYAKRIGGIRFHFRLGELEDTAVFSPWLFLHLLRFRPDGMIVEDLSGLPNSLVAATYCRLFKKPYFIWGLGNVPGKKRSRLRKLLSGPINFLYSGASGFICYSQYAQGIYASWGKPTFLAPNACLAPPSPPQIARITELIRQKYLWRPMAIITIGELKKQKRFDALIIAFSKIRHLDSVLHIIGDGPEMQALRSLAKEHHVYDRIHFHGAIFDKAKKQEILSQSGLGVLPGRGGLVIQELMHCGVPVISGAADGTERDNIVNEHNGYLLEDSSDITAISNAIDKFFSLPDIDQIRMAEHALAQVVSRYNIQSMAHGVMDAVCSALKKN